MYYDVWHANDYNYISSRIIDKGKLKGYVVATREEGSDTFNVGFSLKNAKDPVFNKEWGMNLALTRSVTLEDRKIKTPISIKKNVDKMIERAQKYFKGASYSNNCI